MIVERPWGSYESLALGEQYQVKRIIVKPQQRLSLQSHEHRDENWVVVQGVAVVTKGEEEHSLFEGESIFIPRGEKHRLYNLSRLRDMILIEVQTGNYLGEDDIVRYEDDYQRIIK